jgi:autotransporter-associated beta strand protein
VSAGSLFVNGSTTVASNTITVAAAATLGGTGTIAGMINLVGASTIAPGTGGTTLGALTTGRVNFINLSVTNIDLDGLASSSDALLSSSIINCTGTLNVTSVTNPVLNKVYTILSNSSLSGNFASKAENSIFTSQGRSFRINYTSTAVTLTDVTTAVVWSGNGANGLWTTNTNWVGNIAPVTGNDVVFAGTNTTPITNNTNTAGMAFGSLTFDATAGAFTLSGNQITLGSSLTNNSTTTQIITMPIDITAARTIDTASGNIDLNAIVSGSGGITKAGSNTLTLSAANNYTGTTTVNAGNLLLRGSIAGGGTVTVNTTGTLSGDGVITGAVTVANGGSISPGIGGNTLATLATGAVTLANGSTYVVDINGVNSDAITATGTASIDGTLTITSFLNPGSNPYTIVTASSVTGTFTGLPQNAVDGVGI